jgi:hypothetical protein
MGKTMETVRQRNTVARGIRQWYGNDASQALSQRQHDEFSADALGMGPELLGICKACGTVQAPVEPDATSNPCESCDVEAVIGFSEVMMHGFQG